MHVQICHTRIFSKPPDTMEEFRAQMRYSLRIIFFIRIDSWNSEEEKGSHQVFCKFFCWHRWQWSYRLKFLHMSIFIWKGLWCFLATRTFGSGDVMRVSWWVQSTLTEESKNFYGARGVRWPPLYLLISIMKSPCWHWMSPMIHNLLFFHL